MINIDLSMAILFRLWGTIMAPLGVVLTVIGVLGLGISFWKHSNNKVKNINWKSWFKIIVIGLILVFSIPLGVALLAQLFKLIG